MDRDKPALLAFHLMQGQQVVTVLEALAGRVEFSVMMTLGLPDLPLAKPRYFYFAIRDDRGHDLAQALGEATTAVPHTLLDIDIPFAIELPSAELSQVQLLIGYGIIDRDAQPEATNLFFETVITVKEEVNG